MNILIATGIYPPQLGGPAKYAKNLYETWTKQGHVVIVKKYDIEHTLPTGIRHIFFFFKILPTLVSTDFVLALDTFSVGLPTALAAKILGVPLIVRTGGDFLWESYVERTKEKVLFKDFYTTKQHSLNTKEQIIYLLTKATLALATKIVFSTAWQRDVWMKPYGINEQKVSIIENFYGPKEISTPPVDKLFLGSARPLVWKNLDSLPAQVITKPIPNEEMMKTLAACYAVIVVSLGDISPNFILEAITYNKPFILTKENGISERVKDCAIFVDPLDSNDIQAKINWLSDDANYQEQKKKVEAFTFTHTWEQIADEFKTLI
jgi:glycosyltransferase involved in cell wall biosynthesis